jgi:hypothetical protein
MWSMRVDKKRDIAIMRTLYVLRAKTVVSLINTIQVTELKSE